MTKIVVFTDTHMRPEVEAGRLNPDEQLRKGLAHVNAFNSDADCVVFCGDLTHQGTLRSYEMLRDRLKDLNAPYKLLLGNHDHRENFLTIFPDEQVDQNGFVQAVIEFDDVNLVCLDTLNGPPYKYPYSHQGFLCEKRLEWLDQTLINSGNKPCIIFMHHPPHNTGFRAMDTIKLMNGDAFYEVLKRHQNVRQLVCGHIHRTISGSNHGIPFCVFKSTVGQMPMLFDTMDFNAEVNEPSAYGIIFTTEDGVLVQTEDYELSDLSVFQP